MSHLSPLVGGGWSPDVTEILDLNQKPLTGAGFLSQLDRAGVVGSSGMEVKDRPVLSLKRIRSRCDFDLVGLRRGVVIGRCGSLKE